MKKLLRILAITLGGVVILLILLPILFKSKIEAIVKEKINESVYATVDWSRFSLSLFRGFPELSINLHQVSVVGVEVFEGDTLLGLKRFELRANPFSAFRQNIQVNSILLDGALINGIVLENGKTNWDISRAAPEGIDEEDAGDEGSSMILSLEKFTIKDGRVYYMDAVMGAEAAMEDFNLVLSGDFSVDETELTLFMDVHGIDAGYEGIRYMKNADFSLDLDAAVNLLENRYTILENEMMINNLVLGTRGEVLLLEDGAMDLDISFFSKKTSFQTLLSLIPAIYLSDFESLEASGSLVLEGDVKGIMADSLMPDVLVKLEVTDGYFSYPELPKDVSDVQIKMVANYDGKNTDQTTVDVEKFHLLMAGNPFDIKLRVDHPISDMHVAGEMKGIIDFGSLKDVLPLEDMKLEGRMTSDLRVDTRMSYIEQENFEAVDLNGLLLVEGMVFETPDVPVPVEIRKMEMIFNPRYVSLSGADLQLGQSDLHMEGAMSNFIPYVFKGETISGALKVSSTLLNADELLAETEEAGVDSIETAAGALPDSLSVPSPAKIPANVDIVLELDLKKLIYEGILLEDITGELKFKEGVAYMDGLEMDVIKGHATAQGKVDTRGEFTAAELTLDLQEVDIPTAYSTFITVERLAPMAKYCMGYANLTLDFASLLDASFSPLYESVSAEGRIFTRDLKLYNTSSFVRLSEILKNEKFREMAPDDMNIKFRIKEGKVIVDPFDLMFNESKITVSGLHGIDMSMDYLLDMKIAKSDLGRGAGEILDGVSAMALSAGIAIPQSDYIKIRAMIKGTFQDPQITTDLSSNLATGKAEVKKMVEERVIEEIEKVEEEIREGASEKADEILKQAEQESARVMNEARKAGEQLIQEAEKQGENLIKEAGSNPLKKMAANKAADELLRQAQKQSDNLQKEAQLKSDEIMEKAKTEAGRI